MQRVINPHATQRTAVQAGLKSDPLEVRVAGLRDGRRLDFVDVIPAPTAPLMCREDLPRGGRGDSGPFSLRVVPVRGCRPVEPDDDDQLM